MGTVKKGFIVQVNRNEHFGVIREFDTNTEWIFYFENISKEQRKEMRVYATVSFQRDDLFEQFVAKNMRVEATEYRRAV